jgi:class 3 adenylate cyclase/tetratricopeptide (TPR) repeat protein
MLCPNCKTDNDPGRKFCGECGSSLALLCANCGAPNPPTVKFCGECGASVQQAAHITAPPQPVADHHPPASERRLVSVLFADLVGFTTLSESRDAEEVRELLSHYFDTARELISRYGGMVEKFIGDAVMAVWGTPIAHEDDAERAVRAALELVDSVSALGGRANAPDLRLRAGVLTGEAAVTIGAQSEGMVAGDLVNTASRLQSAASPGTVLVGKSTFLAANKAIAFVPAGEHILKGKQAPVEAYRARRVVAGHQGFRKAEALEPPFVGRERELRQLKDLFHATAQESRTRLVSVVGIGGIGKSRLAWEFFKYIDGLVETIYWHQGRCPAYGEGVTFWALGEMVRMRARIVETEDPESSRGKLTAVLDDFVPDADERRWIEPRLAHLLGLESKAPGQNEELFAAWRIFFERISERGPTALVFEDLQWADPGLIDFIEHTLEWARNHRIFIVTLARPELADRRPTWGAGQRNFTSVYLEPLDDHDVAKLLSGLASGLPQELIEQVVERAEGVPLYAVESVRMLVDRGDLVPDGDGYRLVREVSRLDVPDTLHSLIASRLDSLAGEDRALVQDASVLGKTFTMDALAAVSAIRPDELEPRLKTLVKKELFVLEADPRSPERGQYGFVQSLIREVAYQTLSRHDRLTKHVSAAEHFAAAGDEELASVVASHYIEAHDLAPQGSEAEALGEKARAALVSAASRAASLGAQQQALGHLKLALSTDPDPQQQAVLLEQAAFAALAMALYDEAETYFKRARGSFDQLGDQAGSMRVSAGLGRALIQQGHHDAAMETLTGALSGEDHAEDEATARALSGLASAYMFSGEAERAIEWADKALAIAERLDLIPLIASGLITRGLSVHDAGRPREGIAALKGAVDLASEHDLPHELARALGNLSDVQGPIDPRAAQETARRAFELSRRLGWREPEVAYGTNACYSAFSTGDWGWIGDTNRQLAELDLPAHLRSGIEAVRAMLARFVGNEEEAKRAASSMVEFVADQLPVQILSCVRLSEAWTALVDGDLGLAHAKAAEGFAAYGGSYQGLLNLVVSLRALLLLRDESGLAVALRELQEGGRPGAWLACNRGAFEAGLAILRGARDVGIAGYVEAAAEWRVLGVPFDLALSQLDFVTLVGPSEPHARKAADEALEIFTALGAKPFVERLEQAINAGTT